MCKFTDVFVLFMLFWGCATAPQSRLGEAEIPRLTEKLSYSYCHTGSSAGYPKVGCELTALFLDNTWSVMASSIYRNDKGETLGVMGSDRVYIFSPSGKLLSELSGM